MIGWYALTLGILLGNVLYPFLVLLGFIFDDVREDPTK